MPVSKIQIGQLWKKDGTGDTYLVTRVYSEALSTIVVLRKSGSEGEALIRVRAGPNPHGTNSPRFLPGARRRAHLTLRGVPVPVPPMPL